MKKKIVVLFSVFIAASVHSFAQVRTDISVREHGNNFGSTEVAEFDYNAHDYCVGVGLGSSKMYGDLPYSNPQPVYIADLNKSVAPRFSLGWTVQIGDLSSRDPYTHMRSFNHYTAFDQHITCEFGTFYNWFDKNYDETPILKLTSGLYVGVGLGVINNDVKRIADVNVDALPGITQTSNPPILSQSTALFIPFNFGYNLHLPHLWKLRNCMLYANFQYNDCLSDYVDGYKLPFKANKKNDVFTVMSVGLRVFIFHTNRVAIEY
jgi:hypothetical protein